LRDLRMGSDIDALQRTRAMLPLAAKAPVAALLGELTRYFGQRAGGRAQASPAPALACIDQAIAAMLPLPSDTSAERLAVAALVGLRRNLFADAPPALTDWPGTAHRAAPASPSSPASPASPTEAFA